MKSSQEEIESPCKVKFRVMASVPLDKTEDLLVICQPYGFTPSFNFEFTHNGFVEATIKAGNKKDLASFFCHKLSEIGAECIRIGKTTTIYKYDEEVFKLH